jgi:hypothetical protein
MYRQYSSVAVILCLILSCVLFTNTARATIAIRLNILELTLQSKQVVEGTVVAIENEMSHRGMIVTRVTLSIEEALKGDKSAAISFRVPGGTRPDGARLAIAGAPSFTVGEKVIVFLEGKKGDIVTGLSQGKFLVQQDGDSSYAVQNTKGLCLLDAKPSLNAKDGGPVTDWAIPFSSKETKTVSQLMPGPPNTGKEAAPVSMFDSLKSDSELPNGRYISGGVLKVPLSVFRQTVRDCSFEGNPSNTDTSDK